MRQLTAQFPIAPWRVVYTASGNTLAAAIINDHLGIVEYKLYWAAVKSKEEAQYLTAILNTPILDRLVKPYQSTGAFGPRDFDKYLWQCESHDSSQIAQSIDVSWILLWRLKT